MAALDQRLCLEQGVAPAYLCVGAAGAVFEYLRENEREQTTEQAKAALAQLSGIVEGEELQERILAYYGLFACGESLSGIRRAAQRMKAAAVGGAV